VGTQENATRDEEKKMMKSYAFILAAVVIALALPHTSRAVDGAIEISNTKALAGGVTGSLGSDPPGYPVTIQNGKYVLTSDLYPEDADAIFAGSSNATIDMNGFSIAGDGSSGHGITGTGSLISVRNGTIVGMPGDGISLGPMARVEGVASSGNGGRGIAVGTNSVVRGCQIAGNSGDQLVLGTGSGY
jgi:hypothetical protein